MSAPCTRIVGQPRNRCRAASSRLDTSISITTGVTPLSRQTIATRSMAASSCGQSFVTKTSTNTTPEIRRGESGGSAMSSLRHQHRINTSQQASCADVVGRSSPGPARVCMLRAVREPTGPARQLHPSGATLASRARSGDPGPELGDEAQRDASLAFHKHGLRHLTRLKREPAAVSPHDLLELVGEPPELVRDLANRTPRCQAPAQWLLRRRSRASLTLEASCGSSSVSD